ncbi:MAG: DNA photolyase [Rubellimicrobium sp.]|nr:DNA photolyase [Rubellimicrobium sp.]
MADFPPTRAAALDRLAAFAPRAGRDYAARRNLDLPGHADVSRLSPWLRHRLITEDEVLAEVLRHHSPQAADKFIAEVFWRTYWKGWLELRPAVWSQYWAGLEAALNRVQSEGGLRRDWADACAGRTGIDCFDHWAQELAATGYLHNHARMWFASIWIFTLRLPWELGADFFLRHLLDGDPASNTLSWRWVGGIQTPGKTYLARPDNIETFTAGRFRPAGLAAHAPPLAAPPAPGPRGLPAPDPFLPGPTQGLLLTEEDLAPDWLFDAGLTPVATATLLATDARSPLATAPQVIGWARAAMADCTTRHAGRLGPVTPTGTVDDIVTWAATAGLSEIVTPHIPTGPTARRLEGLDAALAGEGIAFTPITRPLDARAWPRATHGFFRFREAIPELLGQIRGWRLI